MPTKTDNYGFELIDFNKLPWHEREWNNWRLIDAVFSQFVTITNLKGIWETSLVVAVGERYVDVDLGTIWTCEIAHTTPATGTFAESRDDLGGDYWTLFSTVPAVAIGAWSASTSYSNNSFLHDSNRYGVTTATYTSSDSYDTDVTNGNIITLIDLSTDLAAAAASASSASDSADDAAASAASLNLPDPIVADRALFGNSGETAWEQRTAADARTALGLVIGTDVLPEIGVVSQADAEAGTATDEKIWTAERVKQAIEALAPGSIPSGTVMLFYQETVPTGWSRVTTSGIDNHAIKIDTQTALGSFTGSNGTNTFTAALGASGLASQNASPGNESHSHSVSYQDNPTDSGSFRNFVRKDPDVSGSLSTDSSGSGSSHAHDMDIDINYINVFLASKDA